ncbi:MAG: 16S rRNA (uracil(1498)-N(3))-methyltransferase [Bacteroidales bacterium]|nr:16S rRNA (uracil(1498)-N(3))-methyltransferase [Bacteroidales bacterium]
MQLFYAEDLCSQKEIVFDKNESAHISKVLRLKEGEHLSVTNGKGSIFDCELLLSTANRCIAKAVNETVCGKERSFNVHLAVAPTKNINRMEWLTEKAVEIGVDTLTFIVSEHSERRTVNTERLDKIIISALKQSVKAYKPEFCGVKTFDEFVKEFNSDCKYICTCNFEGRVMLKDDCKKGSSVIILIGPEGDFSDKEVVAAVQSGYKPVSLGSQRLRTETAALYALGNIHFINQ